MKPIQTKYKNIFFRSRTEARWAVFFDLIGYRWQYEEQGYLLETGERYLPDFKLWLPNDVIYYVEIKNYEFDDLGATEMMKLRCFAKQAKRALLILPGAPEYRPYNLVMPDHDENSFCAALFQDYEPYIRIADVYWFSYFVLNEETGRFKLDIDDRAAANSFGQKYVDAIYGARSARFEHGESPSKSNFSPGRHEATRSSERK